MDRIRSSDGALARVVAGRRRRSARRRAILLGLGVLIVAAFVVTLMVGRTFYGPDEVLAVLFGRDVQGATFTVGRLRLPRAVLAVVAGAAFGMSGAAFQTMLRNPLASPDIIGITWGSGAAAAFAIVVLGLGGAPVSAIAIVAGLAVALAIYLLSRRGGLVGLRLVLIGIGVAAMLHAVTLYILSKAPDWEAQEAMRWLAGSLNGANWQSAAPVLVALTVLGPVLVLLARDLDALRLGDDTAAGLGVRTERTRLLVLVAAVGLLAFATAATGPIAFVAFLAGPIASRLVGADRPVLVPAALIGALLVIVADFTGQFLVGARYPVGVITGVLGAPYLLFLIIRSNRTGGSP
nr:iron chelate uptake ABC transporter family permease subunit [Arenivirga flava]